MCSSKPCWEVRIFKLNEFQQIFRGLGCTPWYSDFVFSMYKSRPINVTRSPFRVAENTLSTHDGNDRSWSCVERQDKSVTSERNLGIGYIVIVERHNCIHAICDFGDRIQLKQQFWSHCRRQIQEV
jgi:hypothetical protein